VAGWVKLWRTLKENGHLKMPGTSFKLWIYCLLEAVPYPDRARLLETGELWLSYEHVRQVIGEVGRQMSKSTVSNALKYLEQNGYIELQVKKFYGVKVRVVKWREYQTSTETVPVESSAGTETVPVESSASTETVPVESSASTETVPVPVPDPVLVRKPGPYSGAACEAPKNIKNKDLNVVVDLKISFEKEFCRPLSPLEVSQIDKWSGEFHGDLILEALKRSAIQNKRTLAYIGGILANWQRTGICTVEEARQEKSMRSRRQSGQADKQEQSKSKKKDFIRSLYI